ncbi:helix-turn-helix domain-containing protein [Alkaliphilus flagellatus]|uniref:helix-turn-helix domain-containing protein n=1 Tax=Alkaliphilus flagellatus TaxID=2841507 RepID=UPI001C126D0B|nr:helix-turn-helix domain-containing protein [Alkaliphilus flagellatus]
MGQKPKVSAERKIKVVEDYLSGIKGLSQILLELQVNEHSFREWVRKYNLSGREGLITSSNNK